MSIFAVPAFLEKFRELTPGVLLVSIKRDVWGALSPLLSPALRDAPAPTVRANVAGVDPEALPPDSDVEDEGAYHEAFPVSCALCSVSCVLCPACVSSVALLRFQQQIVPTNSVGCVLWLPLEHATGVDVDRVSQALERGRAEVHAMLAVLQSAFPLLTNGGIVVGRKRVLFRGDQRRLLEECW
jgi:hypothetical protein